LLPRLRNASVPRAALRLVCLALASGAVACSSIGVGISIPIGGATIGVGGSIPLPRPAEPAASAPE
jgi:hypothetical protein